MSEYVEGLRVMTRFGEPSQRWADAAPKMTMAFCEAGYPCRLEPYSFGWDGIHSRVNEIQFSGPLPPDEVIMRAATLCGIGDLLEGLVREGYRSARTPDRREEP